MFLSLQRSRGPSLLVLKQVRTPEENLQLEGPQKNSDINKMVCGESLDQYVTKNFESPYLCSNKLHAHRERRASYHFENTNRYMQYVYIYISTLL